jgi:hypothetical protein
MILAAVLLLVPVTAFAQPSWERIYGGPGYEEARCARQTADGGYIVACGVNDTLVSNHDIWLIKTDAQGETLWTRLYGGPDADVVYSVRQTTDSGYILAGYTDSYGSGGQVYLIKTNASGDVTWSRLYGGADRDAASDVAQTVDGGYIVAGYTSSFGDSSQAYFIKTNASGDSVWARVLGGTGQDWANSVQQTADSGYIAAGGSLSFGNLGQAYLIKLTPDGSPEWSKVYGGAGDDYAYSVQQTADGGYIFVGVTTSFGSDAQVYLVKTNASGDTLWTRNMGGADGDGGSYVQQCRDSTYIITGETYSYGNGGQVYLIKTNLSGDTLWTPTFGGGANERSSTVQQTTDGGYVIAGMSTSFGNRYQAYLIKTEADGMVGVDETPHRPTGAAEANAATIIRGALVRAAVRQNTEYRAELLDAAGRRVMELQAGANEVSGLAPGVYFIRGAQAQAQAQAIRRVVITR